MSNETFLSRVFNEVAEEYVFLDDYQGIDKKILARHEKCGYKYQVTPYHFLHRKQRCPNCNKFKKKTPKEFAKEFKKVLGNDYELISEYKGAKKIITVKHRPCGNVYTQIAHEAIIGKGCLACAQKVFIGGRAKQKKDFREEFLKLSCREYELLSDYKGDSEKICVKHVGCGLVYQVAAGSFLQGRRCPKCAIKIRAERQTWSQSDFENFVANNGDNEYQVIGCYENSQKKIEMKHLKCDFCYKVTPRDFVSGKRCPRCRASHGEKFIEKWLKENDFDFEMQFKMAECKVINPLPFDFAIFKDDKMTLIEYQGIQHYQPISLFGGQDGFKKRVKYDNVKRSYCQKNNIELIEIPYYYDGEKIINTIYKKLC